jgi:hypothetical protein
MTGLESAVRRWIDQASRLNPPSWAVGIAIALLGWKTGFGHPVGGLDASWMTGLYMAAHDHMKFGTEIVFTYGPLGFLRFPWLVYPGDLSLISYLYSAALFVGFCIVLVVVLRRRVSLPPAALVALLVVVQLGWVEFSVAISLMAAMLIIEKRPGDREMFLLAVAGGIFAGAEMLIKLSGGPVIALVLLIGLVGARARVRIFAVYLLTTAVSMLAMWFATGQDLANIPDFIANSAQIVTGYQEAMSLHGQSGWYMVMILFGATACVAWAFCGGYPDRRARWAAGMVALLVAFAFYKQSVIRVDRMHIATFFALASLLFLAVPPRPGLAPISLGGLACLAVVSMYAAGGTPRPGMNLIENVSGFVRETRTALSTNRQRDEIDGNRTLLQFGYSLTPAMLRELQGHRVSVDPWEVTAAWAFGFDWSPVPIFQNYSAYTTKLDQLNADSISSTDGPERILRHTGKDPAHPTAGLDGRFLGWDPPAQAVATLCHFRTVVQSDKWQVLARTPDRCGPLVPAGEVDASFGETVSVPRPGPNEVVLAKVEGAGIGTIENLKSLLFRADERRAVTDDGSYQLVADTASDGLMLRMGGKLAEGRGNFAQAPQTSTIVLIGRSGDLKYEFFRMRVKSFSKR